MYQCLSGFIEKGGWVGTLPNSGVSRNRKRETRKPQALDKLGKLKAFLKSFVLKYQGRKNYARVLTSNGQNLFGLIQNCSGIYELSQKPGAGEHSSFSKSCAPVCNASGEFRPTESNHQQPSWLRLANPGKGRPTRGTALNGASRAREILPPNLIRWEEATRDSLLSSGLGGLPKSSCQVTCGKLNPYWEQEK